jgi:putative endonuclease
MSPHKAISRLIGDRIARLWSRLARQTDQVPSRVALGREGERMAERYLRRRGMRIVARNFRASGAEIDLVAMDRGTLVFVEVKRRAGLEAGAPEEAVDERKREQIRRAAEFFVARNRAGEFPMRFDVVAITGPAPARIEHFKDAF